MRRKEGDGPLGPHAGDEAPLRAAGGQRELLVRPVRGLDTGREREAILEAGAAIQRRGVHLRRERRIEMPGQLDAHVARRGPAQLVDQIVGRYDDCSLEADAVLRNAELRDDPPEAAALVVRDERSVAYRLRLPIDQRRVVSQRAAVPV